MIQFNYKITSYFITEAQDLRKHKQSIYVDDNHVGAQDLHTHKKSTSVVSFNTSFNAIMFTLNFNFEEQVSSSYT